MNYAIKWIDILALWVIIERSCNSVLEQPTRPPPTQRELVDAKAKSGLLRDFIATNEVSPAYAKPPTSNDVVTQAIKRLRETGLLTLEGYYPTKAGRELFSQHIGTDWRRWPKEIPYSDGKLDLGHARYLPEL